MLVCCVYLLGALVALLVCIRTYVRMHACNVCMCVFVCCGCCGDDDCVVVIVVVVFSAVLSIVVVVTDIVHAFWMIIAKSSTLSTGHKHNPDFSSSNGFRAELHVAI